MRIAALLGLALPAAALAQAAATDPAPKPPQAGQDKVICKSFAEIGSLIASHKECKTRREWEAESQAAQRRLSDCTNMGGSTGAHC